MGLFRNTPKNRQFEYVPRYYDAEKERRKEILEQKIKLERGAFFKQKNRSRLVGAFSEKEVAFRRRNAAGVQVRRTLLLIAMLCLPCLVIAGYLPSVFAVFGLLFLVILFIIQGNKL